MWGGWGGVSVFSFSFFFFGGQVQKYTRQENSNYRVQSFHLAGIAGIAEQRADILQYVVATP